MPARPPRRWVMACLALLGLLLLAEQSSPLGGTATPPLKLSTLVGPKRLAALP